MEELDTIGHPSPFTCPDCGGSLFELDEGQPIRFRCHTGHAFSLRSLRWTHDKISDEALWAALRSIQEKEAILRRLAEMRSEERQPFVEILDEADQLKAFSEKLRDELTKMPAHNYLDDPDIEQVSEGPDWFLLPEDSANNFLSSIAFN